MKEADKERIPQTQGLVKDDVHLQKSECHQNDDADDSEFPGSSGDVQVSTISKIKHSFLNNIFMV